VDQVSTDVAVERLTDRELIAVVRGQARAIPRLPMRAARDPRVTRDPRNGFPARVTLET
jgi:hypothetical protein